jgi:hypothetical protein
MRQSSRIATVALVADRLEALAGEFAGGPLDQLLDGVPRHVGRPGVVDRVAKGRVELGVAAAHPRGDEDGAAALGPHLSPLLVEGRLLVLDVGPVAVSGHA